SRRPGAKPFGGSALSRESNHFPERTARSNDWAEYGAWSAALPPGPDPRPEPAPAWHVWYGRRDTGQFFAGSFASFEEAVAGARELRGQPDVLWTQVNPRPVA